jgi:hypothetical protein
MKEHCPVIDQKAKEVLCSECQGFIAQTDVCSICCKCRKVSKKLEKQMNDGYMEYLTKCFEGHEVCIKQDDYKWCYWVDVKISKLGGSKVTYCATFRIDDYENGVCKHICQEGRHPYERRETLGQNEKRGQCHDIRRIGYIQFAKLGSDNRIDISDINITPMELPGENELIKTRCGEEVGKVTYFFDDKDRLVEQRVRHLACAFVEWIKEVSGTP